VESAEYKALVMEIDECIARLPVYRAISEGDDIGSRGCRIADAVPEELKQVPGAATKTSQGGKTRKAQSFSRQRTSKKDSESGEMKSGRAGESVESTAPGRQYRTGRYAKEAGVNKSRKSGVYEDPQIRRLERKLLTLRQTCTENHPDVIAVQRKLNALRSKAASSSALEE
jgi:hypothetical protein